MVTAQGMDCCGYNQTFLRCGMCMRYRLFCIYKALHRGIILELTSNRRVPVVIIKASYFEVYIGPHKFVILKRCTVG